MNGLKNNVLVSIAIKHVDFDIVCISETHLAAQEILEIENYTWYGNNRALIHKNAKRFYGGVGILMKTVLLNFYDVAVIDKCYTDVLTLKLTNKFSNDTLLLICAYLPPETSSWGTNAIDFYQYLLSISYAQCDCDMIVMTGDFNSRLGNMSDFIKNVDNIEMRSVIDKSINKHGRECIQFLLESKFCVVNGRVTPEHDNFTSISVKGAAVVDYIFVPISCLDRCLSCKVHTSQELKCVLNVKCDKVPDHSLIEVNISVSYSSLHVSSMMDVQQGSFTCFNNSTCAQDSQFNHMFERYYLDKVDDIKLDDVYIDKFDELLNSSSNNIDINKIYDYFTDIYYKSHACNIKCKDIRKIKQSGFQRGKPFWNAELGLLSSDVNLAQKEYLAAQGNIRKLLRIVFIEKQHLFDTSYRRLKRNYTFNKQKEIDYLNSHNPTTFWKAIKKLGPSKVASTSIPWEIISDNGSVVSNRKIVLDKWQSEFDMLLNTSNGIDDELQRNFIDNAMGVLSNLPESDYIQLEMNKPITEQEIEIALKRAKNGKAVGSDGLPYEFFKNIVSVPLLYDMFNLIFNEHCIPSVWKACIIKPLRKPSTLDYRNPLEYRGISLLPSIYKLFANVLNRRIINHVNSNNIYADEQNGFRSSRSCEEHVFTLLSVVRNRINAGQSTYVAYLDAEKAFDHINRSLLLYKLHTCGIAGKLFKIIKVIYSSTDCIVNVNNCLSGKFKSMLGVRQGDPLSPTLFNIYVNDLPSLVSKLDCGIFLDEKQVCILMFADDIVLISNSAAGLQKQLDAVSEWGSLWQIKFNAKKSIVVHYRPKRTIICHDSFTLASRELSIQSDYKYLGITLNEHLDLNITVDILSSSATRALGAIINKHLSVNFDYNTFTKLFNTCVIPVLHWCCGVWGFKQYKQIENVFNNAMRVYLCVNSKTPIAGLIGDMAWLNARILRYKSILKLWNRIMKMENKRLTKYVLLFDHKLRKNNWSSEVKEIAIKVNQLSSFTLLQCFNIKLAMESLNTEFIHLWKLSLNDISKLRLYKMINVTFMLPDYVTQVRNRRDRSILSKLRFGCLDLEVETGRWRNIERCNRICKVCQSGSIEDELHFVFNCISFNTIRNKYCKDLPILVNVNMDVCEKFVFLLTKCTPKLVSIYIRELYDYRKDLLYLRI